MFFKDPGISNLHGIFPVVCDLLDKRIKDKNKKKKKMNQIILRSDF